MGVNITESDGSRVETSAIYAAGSGGINLHGKLVVQCSLWRVHRHVVSTSSTVSTVSSISSVISVILCRY